MATAPKPAPPQPPNGVITGGGSRKKPKRKNKQAAKQTPQIQDPAPAPDQSYDGDPAAVYDDDYEYSDGDPEDYHDGGANGYSHAPPPSSKKRGKKKGNAVADHAYDPDSLSPHPGHPPAPTRSMSSTHKGEHFSGNIWNVSSTQERENIKQFWLDLSEDERKGLLRIEKEAVLRKMKQQQKHSCSCTVCGRKRTAIEEELEVLYEGYYEELEQYAHHDQPPLPTADGLMPDPLQHKPHPFAIPPPPPAHTHHHHHHHHHSHHRTSHLHEHLDEDEYSDEEEYSEDEEDEYTDDEPEPPRGVPDFLNFGQNLTVKGILTPWLERLQTGLKGKTDNLLTVADDLLKNDGRKFIEMMEQLAERRMQRESEAEYAAANPTHPGAYPPNDHAYSEDHLAGDEFDDEEGSYDSQEEYDDEEEEDEMGGLTEEQRMQEGKRMFQIFAARMFEQRVLQAYREKVAKERQDQLLAELEDEDKLKAQREAKKERDAQKKKEKKKQQQQAKAEEKARKEAEKAAEEARLREAEEKKQEEARRKKEEQRKKREEEKKREQEERARKEEEKARRLREEQQRREETERKAREAKAAEKAKKEEARKKEREEREAREKEAREKKMQEERERKEREAAGKAEKEAREREKSAQQAAQPPPPQIQKRPSQAGVVAVPGLHAKQSHSSSIASPHLAVATPALPKSHTPTGKQRQASQQGSHTSSPKQAHAQAAKSTSPNNPAPQQPTMAPKTILQKPQNHQPSAQPSIPVSSTMHQHTIQPPPGMPHPAQHTGFGMSPVGFPGFPGHQGPMMHNNMGRGMPLYPPQGPPMGHPSRMPFGASPNAMPTPPPGMMPPQHGRGTGFPFDAPGMSQPPPGFGQPISTPSSAIGQSPNPSLPGPDVARPGLSAHSRQHSAGEKERFENGAPQPIGRPAPIQRPNSGRPSSREVDDLSNHLGSSALLADDDEPLPSNGDSRRQSNPILRNGPPAGLGFGPPAGFGGPAQSWNNSNIGFGPAPGLGQQWGSLPHSLPGIGGWPQQNNAFAPGGGFGPGPMRPSAALHNRPLAIRLAVCQACKQLSEATGGAGDGYHDVHTLLRKIEMNRPLLESPPSLRELEDICETEGDSQNGGGELDARKGDDGILVGVRFVPELGTVADQTRASAGLGEIGSPLPGKTSPVGFGAPGVPRGIFPNLGAVGGPPSGSNV